MSTHADHVRSQGKDRSSSAKGQTRPQRAPSIAWMSSLKVLRFSETQRARTDAYSRIHSNNCWHRSFAARSARPAGCSFDRADCLERHFQVRAEFGRISPAARWAAVEWLGADLSNSRFQPAAMAGLTREEVPLLRLKWAFGFLGRPAAVVRSCDTRVTLLA
jgi:hypothetical protein